MKADVLAVTIRAPFEPFANAAMERSISSASRTLNGTHRQAGRGPPGWEAPHWPKPYVKTPNSRHSRHTRREFFDKFKPLPACAVFARSKAGDVAARPRQAIDETRADRVGDHS